MKLPGMKMLVLLLSTLLLVACSSPVDYDEPGPEMVQESPGVVPAEFANLENPLEGNPQAIQSGNEAYDALCVQCHGEEGKGDGPAGQGMDPPPGNLADATRMATLSDGYLFWRISEGGAFDPFISLMPAWGTLLSETEIWELVTYIRTLPE
jgi:mono/diheme cytochrome c family protein